MTPKKPVVVVTGASRGLGLELAKLLLSTGRYRLVLTARGSSLERLKGECAESDDVWHHALDVTSPAERFTLVDDVAERWGGVDVLVNNAGIMVRSVAEHIVEADRMHQLEVNYLGPMDLARLVLPGMRARRRGRIINVSSVGGMMAMPTMTVYSASKYALEGASEALSYEVRPWDIYVTLVQPGFINSSGIDRVEYTSRSREAANCPDSPYRAHYEYMSHFIERIMRLSPATSLSVARRILWVIEKRRPPLRVAGTLDARLFALLRRLLPRQLYHEVLYRCLPGIRHWGPHQLPSHVTPRDS